MADNKQTAETMRFLHNFNYSADASFLGTSLRSSTKIGLFILTIIEFTFHGVFLSYPWFFRPDDSLYLFAIVASVLRLIVLHYCYKAINSTDFEKCLKGTKAIQLTTVAHTINCLVLLIASFLSLQIFGYRAHLGCAWPLIIPGTLSVLINLYVAYLMFSFTKHLGLGNLDVINGINPNALIPGSLRNITTLVIGRDPTTSEINYVEAESEYISLEKIVLKDPKDIQFAESAQEAIVNGMILPSGVKIPIPVDNKTWKIVGNEIILN
jgi:hypothetical protein